MRNIFNGHCGTYFRFPVPQGAPCVSCSSPDLGLNCSFLLSAGRGFHLHAHVGAPARDGGSWCQEGACSAGCVLAWGRKAVISWLLIFLLPSFILFQNMSENLKDCLIQTQASLGEMVTIKTEACSPRQDQEYGQPWYAAKLRSDVL